MTIDEVHMLPTDRTPDILLNPEGIIKMKGRAFRLNKDEVPIEMINWIDAYMGNPAEITYVFIAFEYMNTVSTSILVSLLKNLSKVKAQLKKLVIKWYYEEDDPDMRERGEYISNAINNPIEFILTDNIIGCLAD
jgi:hypothetical protein